MSQSSITTASATPATVIFAFRDRIMPARVFVGYIRVGPIDHGTQVDIYVVGEREPFSAVMGGVIRVSMTEELYRLYIAEARHVQFFISFAHVTERILHFPGLNMVVYRLPLWEFQPM
jgi:hypothetical protein